MRARQSSEDGAEEPVLFRFLKYCVTARLRIVGTKCLRRNTSRKEGFIQAPGLWSQGRRDGRNSFGPWQREWPGACSHLGRSGSKDKGIAGARLAVSLSFIILGEPH